MDINSLLSPSSQEAPQSVTTPTPTPPAPATGSSSSSHPIAVGSGPGAGTSSPLSTASSLSHLVGLQQQQQHHISSNLTDDQQQQQSYPHPHQKQAQPQGYFTNPNTFLARPQTFHRNQTAPSMSTPTQLAPSPTQLRLGEGQPKDSPGFGEAGVPARAGTTSPTPSASSKATSNVNAKSMPLHPPPSSRIIPSHKRPNSMDSNRDTEKKDGSEDSDARGLSSRTDSSAEAMNKEPPPAPEKAPLELFEDSDDENDDEDIQDSEGAVVETNVDLTEDDVMKVISLRDKFDLSNVKEPSNASSTAPSFHEHLECVNLLRRGYINSKRSPEYEFKGTLRDERERMLASYPLTEDLWLQWIDDEMAASSKSLSNKVDILELWTRSVSNEPASVKLWKGYTKFVLNTWKEAHERTKAEGGDEESWIDIFTYDMVVSVFAQAVKVTMFNVAESHRIWDKFRILQMIDLDPQSPSTAKVDAIHNLFLARLQVPHAVLDDTFSAFSSFITKFKASAYEEIMKDANKIYQATKKLVEPRLEFELRLKRVYNTDVEGQVWSDYIKWETSSHGKKLDSNICLALWERCTLRYPMEVKVWEEFVFFALETCGNDPRVLPILERASLHCQWSGNLWAIRIQAMEKRFKSFDAIEKVKHKATESRLLIDKEQLFKVHLAWCYVLKRMGAGKDTVDEDIQDFAELGIRSALTEVGYMDTKFRMHRVLINFLTQRGNKAGAKDEWKKLAQDRNKEYDFWLQYYQWAMVNTDFKSALGVLKESLKYKDEMDWPEKIIETYQGHVDDNGGAADVEEAQVKMWRLQKVIGERRDSEAQRYREAETQALQDANSKEAKGKRRRSSVVEISQPPQKKSRAGDEEEQDVEMKDIEEFNTEDCGDNPQDKKQKKQGKPNKAKRDRETKTVIARNLPPEVDELTVRKFFKDCGKINSCKVAVEEDGESATATVEFDTENDVLAARTRDMKKIDDREVQVSVGLGSTVYVTNFPSTANVEWIQDLFKDCGNTVDVRFPSLKYDHRRRFCYVQFASAAEANKACNLHGKVLGDGHALVVSVSDPNNKQERHGAVYEGREIFIRNIDYHVTLKELEQFLREKKSDIESVRLPSNAAGKHNGFGFATFTTKEAAEEAVSTLNDEKLKSRNLKISISEPKGAVVKKHNLAPVPDEENNDSSAASTGRPSKDVISQKTLCFVGVPDTVNDTKIRTLFEEYGKLRKIELHHDHSGVLVEFFNSADAGKATLALDGQVLEGGTLKYVTWNEMINTPAQTKEKKGANPFSKKLKVDQVFVPRKVLAPATGPRRKPGFIGRSSPASEENSAMETDSKTQSGTNGSTRTNEQFREMFLKK